MSYALYSLAGIVFTSGGNHKLSYLGTQNQIYTWSLLDVQAAWLANALSGLIDIPKKEEMLENMESWNKKYAFFSVAHLCSLKFPVSGFPPALKSPST